jgi:hypothetical protein
MRASAVRQPGEISGETGSGDPEISHLTARRRAEMIEYPEYGLNRSRGSRAAVALMP